MPWDGDFTVVRTDNPILPTYGSSFGIANAGYDPFGGNAGGSSPFLGAGKTRTVSIDCAGKSKSISIEVIADKCMDQQINYAKKNICNLADEAGDSCRQYYNCRIKWGDGGNMSNRDYYMRIVERC